MAIFEHFGKTDPQVVQYEYVVDESEILLTNWAEIRAITNNKKVLNSIAVSTTYLVHLQVDFPNTLDIFVLQVSYEVV
jgi:hypothetical protein